MEGMLKKCGREPPTLLGKMVLIFQDQGILYGSVVVLEYHRLMSHREEEGSVLHCTLQRDVFYIFYILNIVSFTGDVLPALVVLTIPLLERCRKIQNKNKYKEAIKKSQESGTIITIRIGKYEELYEDLGTKQSEGIIYRTHSKNMDNESKNLYNN